MYSEDSFFTLSGAGQLGLAVLSVALASLLIFGSCSVPRKWPTSLRVLSAVALLYVFEWVSPQIYYAFYQAIIPGLPRQWVIGMPPTPGEVVRLLSFTQEATLSAHGRGILGWMLVLCALRKT